MNPLLREAELPRFDQIDASHVVPAISAILEENQAEIDRHKMASTPEQAYRAFHEFERLEARLAEAWSPVSHLNAVVNNDELRAAYNACLPLISAYETAQGQDPALKSLFEVLKQNANLTALLMDQSRRESGSTTIVRIKDEQIKIPRFKDIDADKGITVSHLLLEWETYF